MTGGQNPYGQNPFTPGNQNPYGQNPYGAPPAGQAPQGQNPFAQPPAGQPQYGQQGAPLGAGGTCTFCGGYPAVRATVRGHQGFLVMMRFLKLPGNFCRSCGMATYRDMTTKTLYQGWWGIASFIVTPITVVMNLITRGKFSKLPQPTGSVQPPRDPGKPIYQRAGALGALVPLGVIVAIVVAASLPDHSASSASPGDCVSVTGGEYNPDVKVVDCTSTDARYTVVKKVSGNHNGDACSEAYSEYDESGSDDFALCLKPLH
ncbi:hypothetical protein [Streptomyces sp. NPDC020917]|uniref:LppU/SCO3897 family protein n=1 Tax=Streptomyces sp. NPDC020917 TaxID=3365102 RepID=UPI0037B188BD